jgi:hypothetical protein
MHFPAPARLQTSVRTIESFANFGGLPGAATTDFVLAWD